MAEQDRTNPESLFIRGPVHIDLPLPKRDHKNDLVGYELTKTYIPNLLKTQPVYNPFVEASGYYFDVEEFKKFIHFVVQECCFPEGVNTGDPFIPELWQWCIYANIFCWKSVENDRRRYREVFVLVPRKNGKTSALGAIPTLYMFFCDPEKRSQAYCCAADTEQASVNFRHAGYMIEQNSRLISRLRNGKINRSTRSWEHNDGSTFKVLSSVAETKHGLSPSFVYIDEIHAHPDSELIDVMITGTAARRQPLIIYTTTADYDRPSVCNDLYDRAKAICTGIQTDPTFYPVIYEASISDNWEDERVWKRANPNYGKSIYPEHFEQMVRTAKNNPSQLNKFLRLHLNIRTKTETAWIPPHVWANGNSPESQPLLSIPEIRSWLYEHRNWHSIAEAPQWNTSHTINIYLERYQKYLSWYINKVEELRNEECYGGYDNTATRDIAALSLWFPSKGVNLFWGWCPAESIYRRTIEDNVPYNMWYESGILNNTPQETISEKSIIQSLIGDKKQPGILHYFRGLMSVAYDRWGSTFVYESLNDAGIVARPYPQSFAGMNQPCKQMESLLANKDYFHGGNPVLEWMIGNVVIRESPDSLIRPDKSKSTDKIDGIVSSLMALGNHLYPEIQVIDELSGLKKTQDRH